MGGIRLASNDIREVVGRCVMVTFEIVDKRPMDADVTAKLDGAAGRAPMNEGNSKEEQQSEAEAVEMGGNKRRRGDRSYDVSLSLGSNILDPLLTATYGAPGVYTVEFELPRPMLANVVRCFTALPLLLHCHEPSYVVLHLIRVNVCQLIARRQIIRYYTFRAGAARC